MAGKAIELNDLATAKRSPLDDASNQGSVLSAPDSDSSLKPHNALAVRRPSAVLQDPTRLRLDPTHARSPSSQVAPVSHGAQTPELSSRAAVPGLTSDSEDYAAFAREAAGPHARIEGKMQERPAVLTSLAHEILFVVVCGTGQFMLGLLLGNVIVNQRGLTRELGTSVSQKPWLQGSFLVANGLSVIISGSLSDHIGSRIILNVALAWLTVWSFALGFSLHSKYFFFIARAMQGLAVGALTSASLGLLGQTYSPGRRKSRAFSGMAACAPVGYLVGAIWAGALSAHLPWVFWSFSVLAAAIFALSLKVIPSNLDGPGAPARPSIRDFDLKGALLATTGSGCVVAGLTQGSASGWAPYTYALVITGVVLLTLFSLVERKAKRPLVPPALFRVRSYGFVVLSYTLSYGSYSAWQFYAIEFWLSIQRVSSLTAAFYLVPNGVVGVLCTFMTASLLHRVSGTWVLAISALAAAVGPAFFLPQEVNTSYWALSMTAVGLATLSPDLSWAACAVLSTSAVPASPQGAAGTFLMTAQSLSAAIFTGLADTIGTQANAGGHDEELSLEALRSIWWFTLGVALAGFVLTVVFVRIPKTEEHAHVE